jgi:hypothetical protein
MRGSFVSHLVHYILEGYRTVNSKADKQEVRLGIGEWPQSVVFFLTRRIPERQFYRFPGRRMRGLCDVILKHRRDVFLSHHKRTAVPCYQFFQTYLREVPLRITDQETGLATTTVPDHDKFFGIGRGLSDACRMRHSSGRDAVVGAHRSAAAVANSHALAADARPTGGHR